MDFGYCTANDLWTSKTNALRDKFSSNHENVKVTIEFSIDDMIEECDGYV